MFIDHMKSAATRGASGYAVVRGAINAYPVDGADDGWVDACVPTEGRSPARSVLVGAT